MTPARAVHASVGREQVDLYDWMAEGDQHSARELPVELVTALTQDEIEQIDDRLPSGATVESIVGHRLEYHSAGEHRRARHPPPADGHMDLDA